MMNTSSIHTGFVELIDGVFPNTPTDSPLYNLLAVGAVVAAAIVFHAMGHWLIKPQLEKWVKRTKLSWDDALMEHGFFNRMFHLIPAMTLFLAAPILLSDTTLALKVVSKVALLYMMYSALLTLYAFLNTVEDIYYESPLANRAPITGFIQVIKLIFAILVLLLSVSLLIDRSPLLLLSGLTAIAAVLLLIFRDTILGLVAGIQIAANRMFNNGDWIQIDKFSVDGEIIEIGLTNVKIQNWDKTIATIPTYALTNEAIKNWRGMSESGGRRIKRAIHIDVQSVCLCDEQMLSRFKTVRHIAPYIEKKIDELQRYNKDRDIDETDLLNSRKLTNIGTFRAYLEAYLAQHPDIHPKMTRMVRQLQPTALGLPLEIYCFSAKQDWVVYEGIQADIFDHIFAMLPLFGLKAYQRDNHHNSKGS